MVKSKRKYGNVPTVVDGITFDSKAEARRWQELKLLERAGEIRGLWRQFKYPLMVANGVTIGNYVADFDYIDAKTAARVTEDVKGAPQTELFKWKAKHFAAQYGRQIVIVK